MRSIADGLVRSGPWSSFHWASPPAKCESQQVEMSQVLMRSLSFEARRRFQSSSTRLRVLFPSPRVCPQVHSSSPTVRRTTHLYAISVRYSPITDKIYGLILESCEVEIRFGPK